MDETSRRNGFASWPEPSPRDILVEIHEKIGRLAGQHESAATMILRRLDRHDERVDRIEDRVTAMETLSSWAGGTAGRVRADGSTASMISWLPSLSAREWWALALIAGAGLFNLAEGTAAQGLIGVLLGR